MIDNRKLNKACDYYKRFVPPYISKIFNDGVNYALFEYTKSLWHDSNEEPKDDVDILVLRPSGCTLTHHSSTINWKLYAKRNSIKQWCYVDDILPKEGEE